MHFTLKGPPSLDFSARMRETFNLDYIGFKGLTATSDHHTDLCGFRP